MNYYNFKLNTLLDGLTSWYSLSYLSCGPTEFIVVR